jgi:hypothetical protein
MAGARHGMCELTRNGMAWARHGMGTAWHGHGMAWARHGMCELAFTDRCRHASSFAFHIKKYIIRPINEYNYPELHFKHPGRTAQ